MTVAFLALNANTGASTLAVGALGSISIVDVQGNPLKVGAINAGQYCVVVYNGTSFVLTYRYPTIYTTALAGGNVNVDCSGISTIAILVTIAATAVITLTNLVPGTPFSVSIQNTSGASRNFQLVGASPFNATSILRFVISGSVAATNMQTTAVAIPNGTALNIQGSAVGGALISIGVIA
jgi:hypothetical protein